MESIIAGIFGLIIAIVIIWISFLQWANISRLDSWTSAEGKIIERGTFRVTHANRGPPALQHSPLVRYVYQADGKDFTGDSILPKHIQLPERSTVEWAQARANSFPERLTVYYNPQSPTDCFLVPMSRKTFYIMMIAGPVVTVVSLFTLVGGLFEV